MRVLVFVAISLLFASCSNRFESDGNIKAKLESVCVHVEEESIYSYEMKNRLDKIFGSNDSSCAHRLNVKFTTYSSSLVLQKNADPVRDVIELKVQFNLADDAGNSLYKGNFRTIGSYNTLFSPFSSNTELVGLNKNLMISASEEIRRRLILYFKRQNPKN